METPLDMENARRFNQAITQLLAVDVSAMFSGIHRINELLAQHKIPNPMSPSAILDLGITLGSLHMLQATAPEVP